MASHNRGYYRIQRKKHINRKKRIIHDLNDYWYYKYEGSLNKGKIHCSCEMCKSKTNNKGKHHSHYAHSKDWKHSDQQKIDRQNAAVADFERDYACVRDLSTYFPRNINAFDYCRDQSWLNHEELFEKLLKI